jgi:L,D-transpeptidase ErfK/SrfK
MLTLKQLLHLSYINTLLISTLLFISPSILAKTYALHGQDIVGKNYTIKPKTGITMYNLVKFTGVGFEEIAAANPKHDPELHNHRRSVLIPERFVLPNTTKKGIVINVAELRLYYYPGNGKVITYPVGIGRKGWKTPLGQTRVTSKTADPVWRVPKSIQLDVAARQGIILPDKIGAGPKNPLGSHALYLGLPGYLIHGTNAPFGVGQRVSSGCIRLLPDNIKALFNRVPTGTRVNIVNQPYKIGYANKRLYLEAHPTPIEYKSKQQTYEAKMKRLIKQYAKKHNVNVNWKQVKRIAFEKRGIPEVIATH